MSFLIYPREDGTTSNSGKGGDNRNRRRPFRRGNRDSDQKQENQGRQENLRNIQGNFRKPSNDNSRFDRLKWIPPKISSDPLPVPDCPWCGKPIKDIAAAIADKDTGVPIHFDCVIARLSEGEILEKGDVMSYIGGGRFGIVHYVNPQDARNFTVKKIIEWENKENRAEWRSTVSDHYSVT